MQKEITILVHNRRSGSVREATGTLDYLVNRYFRYTLECGQSYEREAGNKKINCNPKTAKSLVTNLNNAANNSAANGYSSTSYSLK
jgi:methyltransferase-like protein